MSVTMWATALAWPPNLFETYAVTVVATMLLGAIFFTEGAQSTLMLFPLIIGGVCLLASVAGTYMVKLGSSNNIMAALYKGFLGAAVISAIALLPITLIYLGGEEYTGGGATFSGWNIYVCTLVGLAVTGLLIWITDFYTNTTHRPVRKIAGSLDHGTRHQHHRRPRRVDGSLRHADHRDLRRHPGGLPLGRPLRHRDRGDHHAGADRPRGLARRLWSGDRQRGWHRRDVRASPPRFETPPMPSMRSATPPRP